MDNPFETTGLRHGHADPRGLRERIDAQIQERIDEAVEMAAIALLVELRARHGRPAPKSDSSTDRDEFLALAADLLAYLGRAFEADLASGGHAGLDGTRATDGDQRTRALGAQLFLARQLPDYWQRFEIHRAAHAEARLAAPPSPAGFLKRLFT